VPPDVGSGLRRVGQPVPRNPPVRVEAEQAKAAIKGGSVL
jgi:hypothetical protein